MATYKSYKELKGKTLQYNDKVIILCLEYIVSATHLYTAQGINSEIFTRLALDKESFCTKAYGYSSTSGSWPSCQVEDYEALTRCVLWLFQIAEIYYGKQEYPEEETLTEVAKTTRRR